VPGWRWGLTQADLLSLAPWLNELDCDEWDKQMVKGLLARRRDIARVAKVKRDVPEDGSLMQ